MLYKLVHSLLYHYCFIDTFCLGLSADRETDILPCEGDGSQKFIKNWALRLILWTSTISVLLTWAECTALWARKVWPGRWTQTWGSPHTLCWSVPGPGCGVDVLLPSTDATAGKYLEMSQYETPGCHVDPEQVGSPDDETWVIKLCLQSQQQHMSLNVLYVYVFKDFWVNYQ